MTRLARAGVLPKRLMLHVALPAVFAQERASILAKMFAPSPPKKRADDFDRPQYDLARPGPYAGVKNCARYLNRRKDD